MPLTTYDCPDCCDNCLTDCGSTCRIAIAIWNSNGITDSDFLLSLNGTVIATLPESENFPPSDPDNPCSNVTHDCRGHFIYPPSFTPAPYPDPMREGCIGLDSWQEWTAPVLDAIPDDCDLWFRLTATNVTQCGNYGRFIVYRICEDPLRLCQIYNQEYGMDEPVDSTSINYNDYYVPQPCPITCVPSWCITTDDVNVNCFKGTMAAAAAAGTIVSGPHGNLHECQVSPCQPWWCMSDSTCHQGADATSVETATGLTVVSGPYATSAACGVACGGMGMMARKVFAASTPAPAVRKPCGCAKVRLASPERTKSLLREARRQGFGS